MPEKSPVSPAQEYDSLREELNQSRKYVFERPLVIVGVGLALMTTEGDRYLTVLPALLAGLLLFNFWFTVNRLMSAARIVAYIQVVLEGKAEWRGWETSLREYRIWIKTEPNAKAKVESELQRDSAAVPDALMYYPPIYQLHIVLVTLSLIGGALLTAESPDAMNVAASVVLALFAMIFASYCWKWAPRKMRSLIERNIIIWNHALRLGTRDGAASEP